MEASGDGDDNPGSMARLSSLLSVERFEILSGAVLEKGTCCYFIWNWDLYFHTLELDLGAFHH